MMDQGKVGEGFECLMVSLRIGERATPVAWRVKKKEGEMGYDKQEPLLKAVYNMILEGIEIYVNCRSFLWYGGSYKFVPKLWMAILHPA